MAERARLAGGLNTVSRPVTWGEELSTPTERIDATTIDTLQIAQAILNGKPFVAGGLSHGICRRDKLTAEQLGRHFAECFDAGEVAYMLALTLAVLGASADGRKK
jgi:hypothetical protein